MQSKATTVGVEDSLLINYLAIQCYVLSVRSDVFSTHNSKMVFNASPATAAPKLNKSFVHMAHVSYDRACAQDGCLKRPHPTIIDGDMRWDSGWFLGGLGVGGQLKCNLLGKG